VLTPARFGIGNGMAEEMRIWFVFESELPRLAFYSCGGDPRDVGYAPSDGAEVDGGCCVEGSIRGRWTRANQEGAIGQELESACRGARPVCVTQHCVANALLMIMEHAPKRCAPSRRAAIQKK
jgi:hypothetical protein